MTNPNITPTFTEANVDGKVSDMLVDIADVLGAFPAAKPDPRAWEHLLVYAPADELAKAAARKARSTDLLDTNLSARAINCLIWMGVTTLGDLERVTENALKRQRGLGAKTLREIKARMQASGLSFAVKP